MSVPETAWTARRESVSEWLDVRGLRLHVRRWPNQGAPKLFLLHGWMDVSASFQFVVDALRDDWDVIAPDLRGFGESEWSPDSYIFAHYLADLDALLEAYSPDEPARLVGHSLGGNLVCLYGGVRPARVRALATLDAFGLRDAAPDEAPGRLEKWLQQLRTPEQFRSYPDFSGLARQLRLENPRLTPPRAEFLAHHIGEEDGLGGVIRAADPAHKHVSPALYRFAEVAAVWQRVSAPVLAVLADDSVLLERLGLARDEVTARLTMFRDLRVETIRESGHNLHLEQPDELARVVEEFFRAH
ncbi:alpha/beta hydrolase [Niveibacterium umoris]|uniref:Pimeloyl-ACP methyl ester carboxylesterase n=1 Tax=Niveibacterium umoris TaxID=1193620 RepID=A0A840BQA4_9RHOO|nr:alpha/beta hydrolase [Niveibacterium umoris]MBB4014864.1 pimeloyl-ACP methyl ester carboxylesterase [Niveibacterium umoris]